LISLSVCSLYFCPVSVLFFQEKEQPAYADNIPVCPSLTHNETDQYFEMRLFDETDKSTAGLESLPVCCYIRTAH